MLHALPLKQNNNKLKYLFSNLKHSIEFPRPLKKVKTAIVDNSNVDDNDDDE